MPSTKSASTTASTAWRRPSNGRHSLSTAVACGDAALGKKVEAHRDNFVYSGAPGILRPRSICVDQVQSNSSSRDRSTSNTVTVALSNWNMRSNTSRSCMAIAFQAYARRTHSAPLPPSLRGKPHPRATGENLRKSYLFIRMLIDGLPHGARTTRRTPCHHRVTDIFPPAGSAIKPKIGKPGRDTCRSDIEQTHETESRVFQERCSEGLNVIRMERSQLSFGSSTSPSTNRVSLIRAVEGMQWNLK